MTGLDQILTLLDVRTQNFLDVWSGNRTKRVILLIGQGAAMGGPQIIELIRTSIGSIVLI